MRILEELERILSLRGVGEEFEYELLVRKDSGSDGELERKLISNSQS